MATFTYTAKDKSGSITRGEISAKTKSEAADMIMGNDFVPISIAEEKGAVRLLEKIQEFSLISRTEKVIFARQLSTLVNAGVPLSRSLQMLSKQTKNKKMAKIIADVQSEVEGGSTLGSALEKYEKVFGSIFISMVNSGEIGGILDQTLEKSAIQYEKEHEIIAKIRGAMIYPSVILVSMVGAMIFMMISVVPELAKMFEDMGAELPTSTRVLITVSESITTYGILLVITILGFVFGSRYLIRTIYPLRKYFHFLLLRVPIIGNTITKVTMVRFTSTLGALLESGISIIDILEIISKSTKNEIFKEQINTIGEKVKNGDPLAKAIEESKNFPILVSQMISVGEESGEINVISEKIAAFYEKEVDGLIKNLTGIMEPLLMLFIGGMIGFMMISIIKPIYQLTDMF